MPPHLRRLTPITKRMAEDMKIRNLSQNTIAVYVFQVSKFATFLGKSLRRATLEDVRSFQLHLIEEHKVSWSTFNLSDMMHLSVNL